MRYDKILFDVDVQRDFFAPGGSCYRPEASEAAKNVRRLFAWARKSEVPVLSTVLRLKEGRRGPLSDVPHCLEGTEGEKRISGTLMRRYVDMGMRGSTDLPGDLFERYQQAIFEQRQTDIFQHPRAERLLSEISADTFIMCGAGSAGGIVEAVIGLRQREFKIILAADAIVDLGDPRAEMAWLRMLAKGAVPLSTAEIILAQQEKKPARVAASEEAKQSFFRGAQKSTHRALTG